MHRFDHGHSYSMEEHTLSFRPPHSSNPEPRRRRYGAVLDLDLALELSPPRPNRRTCPSLSLSSSASLSPGSLYASLSTDGSDSALSSPVDERPVSFSDFPLPPSLDLTITGNTTLDDLRAQGAFWRQFGEEQTGMACRESLEGARYGSLLEALAKERFEPPTPSFDFSWEAEDMSDTSSDLHPRQVSVASAASFVEFAAPALGDPCQLPVIVEPQSSDCQPRPLSRSRMDPPSVQPDAQGFLAIPPNDETSRFSVASLNGALPPEPSLYSPTKRDLRPRQTKPTESPGASNSRLAPIKSIPDFKSKMKRLRHKTSRAFGSMSGSWHSTSHLDPGPSMLPPSAARKAPTRAADRVNGRKGSLSVGIPPAPLTSTISPPLGIPLGARGDSSFLEMASALDRLEVSISLLDECGSPDRSPLGAPPSRSALKPAAMSPYVLSEQWPSRSSPRPATSTYPRRDMSSAVVPPLQASDVRRQCQTRPPVRTDCESDCSLTYPRPMSRAAERGSATQPAIVQPDVAPREATRHLHVFKRAARRAGIVGRWNSRSHPDRI